MHISPQQHSTLAETQRSEEHQLEDQCASKDNRCECTYLAGNARMLASIQVDAGVVEDMWYLKHTCLEAIGGIQLVL